MPAPLWFKCNPYSAVVANGNSGANPAMNWASGQFQSITLTANATATFAPPPAGTSLYLLITQDPTGGRTLALPASVSFVGGIAPALDGAPGSSSFLELFYDGATYWAQLTSEQAPGTNGYNPSWYAAGAIFIDPQNVSGTASDGNNGTSAATALRTYREAVRRWGSTKMTLVVATAISFLSSHTDDSDPVIFEPVVSGNVQVSIQGAAPASVAAVFTLNSAKNRAVGTNSLLSGSFSAGAPAVGKLVANTTAGKSSRAWIYNSAGGANWTMTQPLAPGAVGGSVSPAEVDSWASTDTVNVLTPVAVNIVKIAPVSDTGNKPVTLYQLTIFDPGGANTNPCVLSGNVQTLECSSQRKVIWADTPTGELQYITNHIALGAVQSYSGAPCFFAGATTAAISYIPSSGGAYFDADHIIGAVLVFAGTQGAFGLVALDALVIIAAGTLTQERFFYGSSVVYGTGANTIRSQSYTRYSNGTGGTFVAAFTAPGLVTGFLLNGTGTGQSHTRATPDVIASAIATTPANLDAAAGPAGFGGTAFNLGGAQLSNTTLV